MSKTPNIVTMQMIWEKLTAIEKEMRRKLSKIEERELKGNIEEISLSRAKKLLHMSERSILEAVECGDLRAMKYSSTKGTRLRFRLSDIHDYQQLRAEMVVREQQEVRALIALDEDEGEPGPFDAKEFVRQFHQGKIA